MKALAAIVAAALGGGCFASWATVQLAGKPQILDENVRQETVPMPGVKEQLQVRLPLSTGRDLGASSDPGVTGAGASTEPAVTSSADPAAFALGCRTVQRAQDTVYHSAFRYGKKWKYATAALFAVEAAVASAYLFLGDPERPEHMAAGAVLGVDALGTAALFFAPRKDIYRNDVRPNVTTVRDDCPDGLVLEIAGDTFPVDAAGRLGELGFAALDEWMQADAPAGAVRLSLDGQVIPLQLGDIERCSWTRFHSGNAPARCPRYGAVRRDVFAVIEVPLGKLSRVATDAADAPSAP